ncbi:MAG: phosphoglycerate mutase (2,3-diphosphoglycerate-independent) [Gammaproteobacteria bacterium RIFCSPLOWO2_02_FULL_57_10]|nr:MAG: phosphoglycerate mutase (2,3-diphosphoglycerate-independent) [Gammaproteobacteria bacterium RIFCSPLOWO2_02_FULL_57_10]
MTSSPAPSARKTALLLILDGWGYREETSHNAISAAHTPVWDELWRTCPHTLITTSGMAVGLPAGQMGNSEVGHMNLGAGRIVYQNLTRIDKAIEDGTFYLNEPLVDGVDKAILADKAVHILGLISPGGIHSHEDQILAMIDLASQRGADRIYVHAFLDGRDTPPRSALASLQKTEAKLQECGGRIVSIIGRYYAMDRDNRWDRVQTAYDLLTAGKADFHYATPEEALNAAYARGEDDEFVKATSITAAGEAPIHIEDGDTVIYMNFRSDRARQLTRAFTDPDFAGFERARKPVLGDFVTLTEYAANIAAPCAYPPQPMDNVFGEYLERLNKTQLRIAETEKYAHVTFFFSGGREEPFKGETRTLIPSPNVATYDLQPEMSAFEVTDKLVDAIRSGEYDAIVCNYANGDMVGHTGSFSAAVKAVEALDICLGRITQAIRETDGQCLITADHGNVEQMVDEESGQPLTSHTSGPVPLVYVGNKPWKFRQEGSLCDIAPTLLALMETPVPPEMTGKVLMQRDD